MSESDERPEPFEEFYTAIGRFIIAWSSLEVYLDVLLLKIRLRHDEANRPGKLPHQFFGKIECIQSFVSGLKPPVSAHRAAICNLLVEIKRYSETRHDYVHGTLIAHCIDRGTITATFARLLQPSRRTPRRPMKATAAKIREDSNQIHRFGDRLLDILEALNEKPEPPL
jgi:hypothetical protein